MAKKQVYDVGYVESLKSEIKNLRAMTEYYEKELEWFKNRCLEQDIELLKAAKREKELTIDWATAITRNVRAKPQNAGTAQIISMCAE